MIQFTHIIKETTQGSEHHKMANPKQNKVKWFFTCMYELVDVFRYVYIFTYIVFESNIY